MKVKFILAEPFFITPALVIYHDLHLAWLCFEVQIKFKSNKK